MITLGSPACLTFEICDLLSLLGGKFRYVHGLVIPLIAY